MKDKYIMLSLGLLALSSALTVAAPLGTAFTYQGKLTDGGNSANGSYDLTFTLFATNSGGAAVAGPLTNSPVGVTNGLFTVTLDFGGSVFIGNACWLELGARTNGGASFTTLSPRQPLTPSPYSLYAPGAGNAQTVLNGVYTTGSYANPAWLTSLAGTKVTGNISGNAAGFSGSLAGNVTGTQSATVVASVGGQTAANVASGVSAANAATSANSANTIVKRDASGNFAAGTITASLSGNATTATTASSFSGSLAGNVTGTQGATVVASVGGQTAANVASGASAANAATSAATPNAIVKRDATGSLEATNITVRTITANECVVAYSSSGNAVYGNNSNPSGGFGVCGYSTGAVGVGGFSGASGGYGVYGSGSLDNLGVGVYGNGYYGVYGNSGVYAGYFNGNVRVVGYLYKDGGGFKIDHPLDPANKYLVHSFVESPDMKNIYDGVTVLDGRGEAVVKLPQWCETLNRDFRYQLTSIGSPGPNLYIAEEISGNQFKIAGGGAGMKVSWQVTGIRQDAYANAHRIPVEEAKPANERGLYLHPELFGQPAEKTVSPQHPPKMPAPRTAPANPSGQ